MYRIKEFAEILAVPTSTIRYYEKKGLFEAERSDNNYRIYSDDDLQQMRLILVMKYAGFSIKEMRELLSIGQNELDAKCVARTDEIFSAKKKELVDKIENLQQIVSLLDMMHPFAIAQTTQESAAELNMQIDHAYTSIKKE